MAQQTWLVTGCSSGFGERFVYEIIARGDRVIATARRAKERLQHLEAAGAFILDLDVTWPQQQIDSTMRQAIEAYGGIDVLINNAGYVEVGLVEDVSQERLIEQCNTNLFGTINVTRSILPHFRQRKAGKIAFIGSIGGFCGIVGGGIYGITKFGLEAVAECLQIETAGFGIQTIIFEAGYFRTDVFGRSMKDNPSVIEDNLKIYHEVQSTLSAYDGNQPGDPKKAAERVIDVLKSEGMAAGRPMPPRLPLGPDSLAAIRGKCEATLKICDEWESLISSTDFALEN